DLYEPVMGAIAVGKILQPQGALIVEHERDRPLPERVGPRDEPGSQAALQRFRQSFYGGTGLSFYSVSEYDVGEPEPAQQEANTAQ
ncbi:MAG: hypothetical protein AAF289_09995, partial [Cyanobacteria bacterium P01_A01_bin.135]